LARPEKVQAVEELKQRIQDHDLAVMTRYIGINVKDDTELRRRLRLAGVTYKVYKNTLALRALRELGLEEAGRFLQGPTAWAFSKDPVAATKILLEFAEEVKFVGMNGGILNGRIIDTAQLEALAKLPPREQLVAQTLGVIVAPLRNLVGALSGVPRNLVSVLDQIRKQKEEQAAA